MCCKNVTVTEALVLCPLLEDRGHITESIRVLVPVDGMKQKCSMLVVQEQKRLCRQFVDVSTAQWACHTTKQAVFYHIVFSVSFVSSYRFRGQLLLLPVISVYDVWFWLYRCCFAIVCCKRCY